MAWYGAVVWREGPGGQREFCFTRDEGSGLWELPGSVMERTWRESSLSPDTSPFSTARWELWEEAGLWLAWREFGDFWWTGEDQILTWIGRDSGPGPQQSAFVLTRLQDEDEMMPHPQRSWLTLQE